jgi:hypothetical protein
MKDHQIGDAPIEDRYREDMITVARTLDEHFNGPRKGAHREVGFVLLVFPFGDGDGRCNYISNGARREDIVKMMREQIARFEAPQP